MLGYMNQDAIEKTKETGWVYFWSRSKQRLWMKGETSGNRLSVTNILVDCDQDTLLIKVKLNGTTVCHTGNKSCFKEEL
jgi:phosphoribosyl-AMP cyclohydrolase